MAATDTEQWIADMDSWGLTGSQRSYYLMRVHHYHLRLMRRYERQAQRADVLRELFALALVASLFVALLIWSLS